LTALCNGCQCSPTSIAPARIPNGGRTVSLAVSSTNDQRIVAATETGGLFRTYDGGKSWQHLGGLPTYMTRDVAIAATSNNTIITTTLSQYRAINDGGIWRSTDDGGTWKQPPGWPPAPSPNCPTRPSAYGLNQVPLSRTMYAGTDCGLAVSNDEGATWRTILLDSTAMRSDSLQHRVFSVLVLTRNSGVAIAESGVWFIGANGRWMKASGVDTPPYFTPVTHAFASPWWLSTSLYFHASGDHMLWRSTDSGASWSLVHAPRRPMREAWVRAARSIGEDENTFDLYFGDGMLPHRQSLSVAVPPDSAAWTQLGIDHADVNDIAFDTDRRVPILVASDGGVHTSANQGASWKFTGGGFGGFIALQVSEVTGQSVTGASPHQDLYFSTQDNYIWASSNGGQTWPTSKFGEGRYLRTAPISTTDQGVRVTGLGCGGCINFQSTAHLADISRWPNAPVGDTTVQLAETPFPIIGNTYLQNVANTGATPVTYDFYLSQNAGTLWTKSFSLSRPPKGAPLFTGSLSDPIVYQGVERSSTLPLGGTAYGLMRGSNLAGVPGVRRADSLGMIALGSLRTPISRYVVFGVDPANSDHLIAPDAAAGQMKYSANGGVNWFSYPPLTNAVTDNGQLLFRVRELTLASVVAWDPYDSCHILVGTTQNGVIRSADGGNTWQRVDGSKAMTLVSSFYFPPTGSVWVSTNGRGLWTLKLDRQESKTGRLCRFPTRAPRPPVQDTTVVINPTTGAVRAFRGLSDSVVCPRCAVLVVREGWVSDLRMTGDSLREIAITSGMISQIDRSGKESALSVPNSYMPGSGRLERQSFARSLTGDRRVRALVIDGARLVGVIASEDELPFGPQTLPIVHVINAGKSGTHSAVEVGDAVTVIGSGFQSGSSVRLIVDGRVLPQSVAIGAGGSFSVQIPVERGPGELVITAEQRDGRRVTLVQGTIDVLAKDPAPEPPQRR